MKIAIIGPSCSGKTTTARALAAMLGFPVRHCGVAIKEKARKEGCLSAGQLTLGDHRLVDAETREIAGSADHIIIEGTFLDCVVVDLQDIRLIKLDCDYIIRAERHRNREKMDGPTVSLFERDRDDARLRSELFADVECPVAAHTTIDVADMTPREVANVIARAVGAVDDA